MRSVKEFAMSSQQLEDISFALNKARISQSPIDPPKQTWPALTHNDAFEVQRVTIKNAVAGGDRLVGMKLGNIAKVMQDAFGLDQPDYGFLLASTFEYEGTKLRLKDYIKPYVELEPAFVLKAAIRGPNVTVADVISAIDYAIPAIEIIDSRVKNWAIGLEDTLADNGSTGKVILGGTPRKLDQLNLRDTRGYLKLNGKEVMAGNTSNILGNPINAMAWLANRLSEYGVGLEAGQVVLPGSCLQAVPMTEAGRWSCTYEGWGTIEFDVE